MSRNWRSLDFYGKFTFASSKYANTKLYYRNTFTYPNRPFNVVFVSRIREYCMPVNVGANISKKTRKPWSYLKSGHDLWSICSNIKAKDNTTFSLVKFIFTLIYLSLSRTKVNFSYKVSGEFVGQHQRLSLAYTVAGISGTYVWVACEEAPGKNVNRKRWSDLGGVVSLKLTA